MSDLNKRVNIFEDTLADFAIRYSENRIRATFCSEADIRLQLAHMLLEKLPITDVHAELPIPLDVKQFGDQLWGRGRVSSFQCIKADIAIVDNENFQPQIVTELKYAPLYWGFSPLLSIPKNGTDVSKKILRERLQSDLDYLQKRRKHVPNQIEIEKAYFGTHKDGPTTVEKMIQIVNRFRTDELTDVRAYLCVFDEIYPNIQLILDKAVDRFDPPDTFKVLAFHIPISDILEDTLNELITS